MHSLRSPGILVALGRHSMAERKVKAMQGSPVVDHLIFRTSDAGAAPKGLSVCIQSSSRIHVSGKCKTPAS